MKIYCMNKFKNYLNFFHYTVVMGLSGGLIHPIEWAIAVHHAPGSEFIENYHKDVEQYIPEFLYETYNYIHLAKPENADKILKWCEDHYRDNSPYKRYFNFMKDEIQEYIDNEME